MTSSPAKQKKDAAEITTLPRSGVICVILVQICEAFNIFILFPFMAFLVERMGHSGTDLGLYTGGLAASFCGAQFLSSTVWGMASDRYGRKVCICVGTLGAAVGMLVFGSSQTYAQAS
jgi:MFS family permease